MATFWTQASFPESAVFKKYNDYSPECLWGFICQKDREGIYNGKNSKVKYLQRKRVEQMSIDMMKSGYGQGSMGEEQADLVPIILL